jgi:hypothetical protein
LLFEGGVDLVHDAPPMRTLLLTVSALDSCSW